jgi:phage tail-like protein
MQIDAIARMLPWVFQVEIDDPARQGQKPLAALLAVMEALHAPVEDVLGSIDAPFAPYRAPDSFVAYLTLWVDLAWMVMPGADGVHIPVPGGAGRLRDLVASATELSAARGTARGLSRFLEVATGASPVVVESDPARPFGLRITMPDTSQPSEALIRRIIEIQKPAHVTFDPDHDLVFAPQQ